MEMYLFTTYRGIGLTLTNHPKNDFFPGRREPLKFSGNKRAVGHLDPVIRLFLQLPQCFTAWTNENDLGVECLLASLTSEPIQRRQ